MSLPIQGHILKIANKAGKRQMASQTKEGRVKVMVWKDNYTTNGRPSANLLLKAIIRESHLDLNATTASIRTKLTQLDLYLPMVGHNIAKLNAYITLLLDSLAA